MRARDKLRSSDRRQAVRRTGNEGTPGALRSSCRRLLARDQNMPDRQEGLVVVVDGLLAERRELVGVPVALEVLPRFPEGRLAEMEGVLDVSGQGPALGAEGHRAGCGRLPDLVPALRPEGVDMPFDVDDVERAFAWARLVPGALGGLRCAHAPTSARIA